MSALQFLNKKSWHTSKKSNAEKTWLREQQAEREAARTAELQKQLAEERRQEQLENLEHAAGRLSESAVLKRKRLNWMYEYSKDAPTIDQPAKEEFENKEKDDVLLGKKKLDLQKDGDGQQHQRALLVDAEAKMRDDPLLQIQMARAAAHAGVPRISRSAAPSSSPTRPKTKNPAALRGKAIRKEQRRAIREERRRRKEMHHTEGHSSSRWDKAR